MTAKTYTPRRTPKPAISMLAREPELEKKTADCVEVDALAATVRGEGGAASAASDASYSTKPSSFR
jgi:hypothetical protein